MAGKPACIDERITKLAASAPPLTPDQRTRLAALFRGTGQTEQAKAS